MCMRALQGCLTIKGLVKWKYRELNFYVVGSQYTSLKVSIYRSNLKELSFSLFKTHTPLPLQAMIDYWLRYYFFLSS